MSAQTPDPWERQTYDTEESWLIFESYRDQERPRKLFRPFKGRNVSPAKLRFWFKAHFWAERVAQWDAHLSEIHLAEIEEVHAQTAREVAAKHKVMLAHARDIAYRELEKLSATVRDSPGEVLRPRDVFKLAETTVRMERLVLGETTDKLEVKGIDLSSLSEEELALIESKIPK